MNFNEMAMNFLDYPLPEDSSDEPDDIFPGSFADLEEMAQDFVLETKRIEIPGYPDAFNPSLIRWQGSLLLSFRIYDRKASSTNGIGLIRLDENFCILGPPKVLDMRMEDPLSFAKRQDPRLIAVGDRLFITYNNMMKGVIDRELRRMLVAEIHFDGENFFAEKTTHLTHFEGENVKRSEKNWAPFDHTGNLLLSYSINPHRILHPLPGTDTCETVASTKGSIKWKWGVLRGGSPALPVDDEYLAFFHSCENMQTVHSKGKNILHYFMGAYTFSREPPFALTKISPEPIVGKNFYHGKAYKTWRPLHVVFPGGFVHDNNFVWIAYGRQDHEVWIVKLDKKGLMNSLVPVSPG